MFDRSSKSGNGGARSGSRIPASLQAVFLASNRGKDVEKLKPPPEQAAYKVFFRNWRFQRQSGSKKNSLKESATPCALDVKPDKPVAPLPKTVATTLPPQGYLDAMIRSRGYSTSRFTSLQTAYYNKPTALQQASYDLHLIQLVRSGQVEQFRAIFNSGISPNPCNAFGESLLHLICRRGEPESLQVMVDAGCTIQVADDYGRTPLHDACWAARPCFELVEMILDVDVRFFHMTDCRGALPLSYVRKEHWAAWVEFLASRKDKYWPKRDIATEGEQEPPELAKLGPNTRPIPDPKDALTVELATMVATGRIKPDEARMLLRDNDDTVEASDSDFSDDDSEYDSSDYDSDEESDLDDEELEEMINTFRLARPAQVQ